ncbi:MAG: hypothetical protein PHH54_04220 [Candidatus Nanoarchaeia archaeon]|nr:hypothetical protein [Candidatus Nanoarchaeia archaeon]MDD5741166.1 hypothetical protein [Candidatus Nanoarchaeia archaeon]
MRDKNYFQLDFYEDKERFADCYSLNQIKDHARIQYLIKRGYSLTKHYDLRMKEEIYLTKNQKTETPQHAFLVWALLKYLREQNFQVWNYKTIKPDIIFEVQNRKIAIEIETGKNLRNNRKQFLEKINSLYKNFGYNWFFVVTNRDLVKKYKKYGRTYTRKNVIKAIWRYVNFKPRNYMLKHRFWKGGMQWHL